MFPHVALDSIIHPHKKKKANISLLSILRRRSILFVVFAKMCVLIFALTGGYGNFGKLAATLLFIVMLAIAHVAKNGLIFHTLTSKA